MKALTPRSFFDHNIEPSLDCLMEDIQSSGLSRVQTREVIVLICAFIFGMGLRVTEEIEGPFSSDSPGATEIRRFVDHVMACIESDVSPKRTQ